MINKKVIIEVAVVLVVSVVNWVLYGKYVSCMFSSDSFKWWWSLIIITMANVWLAERFLMIFMTDFRINKSKRVSRLLKKSTKELEELLIENNERIQGLKKMG